MNQSYPLNADKMEKGDVIDQETIANFLGAPRNSKAYELGVLQLAVKVRNALLKVDKPCTVVVTKRNDPMGPGAIRVLTDEQAVGHIRLRVFEPKRSCGLPNARRRK